MSSGNPGIHTDDFLSCFMHKPTFYKNQAFGPASLECASLGQVAARLAFIVDKPFVQNSLLPQ